FWMSVLTDLKARGGEDILIACTDNLKGFTEAIKGVFPQTVTQLCIVHQIRNSCKFVVWKDRKEFCKDLKIIYTTNNIENLNRGIRKYTKTKTQFTNENAATKSVFLSIQNIEKSWTSVIQNWGIILHQFLTIFQNRCKI